MSGTGERRQLKQLIAHLHEMKKSLGEGNCLLI